MLRPRPRAAQGSEDANNATGSRVTRPEPSRRQTEGGGRGLNADVGAQREKGIGAEGHSKPGIKSFSFFRGAGRGVKWYRSLLDERDLKDGKSFSWYRFSGCGELSARLAFQMGLLCVSSNTLRYGQLIILRIILRNLRYEQSVSTQEE